MLVRRPRWRNKTGDVVAVLYFDGGRELGGWCASCLGHLCHRWRQTTRKNHHLLLARFLDDLNTPRDVGAESQIGTSDDTANAQQKYENYRFKRNTEKDWLKIKEEEKGPKTIRV